MNDKAKRPGAAARTEAIRTLVEDAKAVFCGGCERTVGNVEGGCEACDAARLSISEVEGILAAEERGATCPSCGNPSPEFCAECQAKAAKLPPGDE